MDVVPAVQPKASNTTPSQIPTESKAQAHIFYIPKLIISFISIQSLPDDADCMYVDVSESLYVRFNALGGYDFCKIHCVMPIEYLNRVDTAVIKGAITLKSTSTSDECLILSVHIVSRLTRFNFGMQIRTYISLRCFQWSD